MNMKFRRCMEIFRFFLHSAGKALVFHCKICSDYLIPKNSRVVYLTNMYLTDWPEWFVQLHSLVEIHVGCQIGDRSLSVVNRGHSTTMWTKVYPILTTPSIGQLWTFYILASLCSCEKAWTFFWPLLVHVVIEWPQSQSIRAEGILWLISIFLPGATLHGTSRCAPAGLS